ILNNNEVLFNELLDNKFIFESKGIVLLFTDVRLVKYPPNYVIRNLTTRYKENKISLNEFLTHLRLISDELKESSKINYKII
ncbi:MAG: hypothetical protein KGD57_09690, partial [Candidatus Lokiarchaeota archaeon]|nr:hypothetical protein [Candidatus Lokiarchaeota archaeon]